MPESTVDRIKKLLAPTADEQRWYEELRSLDPAEAVPALAAVLLDGSEKLPTRSRAAFTLAALGDRRAILPLAEALDVPEPVLRARVARALGRFGSLDEPLVQRLIKGLRDEDYFVRESCAKALGELRHPEALPALGALNEMSTADAVDANREVALKVIEHVNGTS